MLSRWDWGVGARNIGKYFVGCRGNWRRSWKEVHFTTKNLEVIISSWNSAVKSPLCVSGRSFTIDEISGSTEGMFKVCEQKALCAMPHTHTICTAPRWFHRFSKGPSQWSPIPNMCTDSLEKLDPKKESFQSLMHSYLILNLLWKTLALLSWGDRRAAQKIWSKSWLLHSKSKFLHRGQHVFK